MNTRKKFNQLLGLADSIQEEQKRFIERISQSVFCVIRRHPGKYRYPQLFAAVGYDLGVDPLNLRPQLAGMDQMGNDIYVHPQLEDLTRKDFEKTLEVLCIMYAHIQYDGKEDKGRAFLSAAVEAALSRCTCDIGVRWKDGFFYPSGAEELDKPLIEETLTWLKDYPSTEKDYRAALRHYAEGKTPADVMTNCYAAVEGMAQSILGNDRNLDNNKDALLGHIGVSSNWKAMLANYINYLHDHRHTRSEKRHNTVPQEVEACVYMTGLVIRLAIESKRS